MSTAKAIVAAGLAVALLAAALCARADAYTLGIGDRADAPASVGRELGARVYRVVIDPDVPLASYDRRIYRHRAAGMEPQLVIGGTGTRRHSNRWGIPETAVAAFKRWPFAYSVSVVNEPGLSGMSVCAYARTYRRAYRLLKPLGARVLFGEWSPGTPITWTRAIRDWLRAHRSKIGGRTPRLYVTEYGAVIRSQRVQHSRRWADLHGARLWRRALGIARRYGLAEIVAWDVHSPPAASGWDSSLIEPDGRPRPAFQVIRSGVT